MNDGPDVKQEGADERQRRKDVLSGWYQLAGIRVNRARWETVEARVFRTTDSGCENWAASLHLSSCLEIQPGSTTIRAWNAWE